MAKKKANQGRRVVSPLTDSNETYSGPQSSDMKAELDFYGKKRAVLVDISTQMEAVFSLQQNQRREADQMYGIEKKMLDNFGYMANQVKLVALQKQTTRDLSLEESNILSATISDYETYNQEAASITKHTRELLEFRKKAVPFEEKIKSIQSEIGNLQVTGLNTLNSQEKQRLASLKTMEKGYQALSKQEQMNKKIEDAQAEIKDLMEGQGSAASKIFSTLKDIVTNPLTLFTGLLAVGLQRYETMRQRGVEIGEEQDRINKKLAGAGPFQDKIIQKAELIRDRFYDMGEGFSSSLEGSVDAIVALGDQFGKIDYVTGELVKTMAELKLSIGLSDENSAKVLHNFTMVNGQSSEAAIAMTDLTYQMAEQAGLNPQVIFQDIAAASGDTLATFSGSADELAKSAVTARRLGLTLDDMATVSKGLLDFETSIEKEMEAQLITGMDLNFQKARMLAMQGDEAGAMEEVMRQVGGLDKFNNMAPIKQRALAEAVGLTVGQLQKSADVRQREAKQAQMKQDLVKKQFDMAEAALPLLNKLDVGLGVMERIAQVIGDLFLDVFGVGLADLEKKFLALLQSPAFKTGFKNFLFMLKGVIVGIKDAVMGVVNFIDKLSGGAIGGFLKNFASKDFSGSAGTAENWGKTVGTGIAALLGAKLLLGSTPFTPMFVSMGGKFGSMFSGLKKLLSGPLKADGTPDLRHSGNKFGGGIMQNVGSKVFGGSRVTGMGGLSSSAGMALGGSLAGAAIVGKGIYDASKIGAGSSGSEKAGAMSKASLSVIGASIGTMILPGIGTGIGAAIGYLGGMLVEKTGIFDDALDTSRKNLQREQQTANTLQRREQRKMLFAEKKAHSDIKLSFNNLANGTDDLSKQGLAKFKEKIISAGYVTEKEWNTAVSNGASAQDFLTLATQGATSKLEKFATAKQNEIDRLTLESGSPALKIEQESLQARLDNLQSVSRDDIGNYVNSGNAVQSTLQSETIYSYANTDQRAEFKALAHDLFKDEAGLKYSDAALDAALKSASEELNANWSYVLGGLAPEGRTEDILEDMKLFLEKGDATELNNITAEIKRTSNGIIMAVNQSDDITKVFTDDGDALQVQIVKGIDTKAAGGILAGGGITYGPSHANGGIPTKFGELEGGEAVINKRSTAMYTDQLSQLNQAGGGVAFGEGGTTGGYYLHGGKTPTKSLIDKYPLDDPRGAWGQSKAGRDRYGWGSDYFRGPGYNIKDERSMVYTTNPAASLHGQATGPAPETHLVNSATWQYGLGDGYDQTLSKGGLQAEQMIDGEFNPNAYYKAKIDAADAEKLRQASEKDKRMKEWTTNNPGKGVSMDQISAFGHLALDVLGFIPAVGNIADGLNVLWYTAEAKKYESQAKADERQGDTKGYNANMKKYKDYMGYAGLSALAMVPISGAFATVGKWSKNGQSMKGPIGQVLKSGRQGIGKTADMIYDSSKGGRIKKLNDGVHDMATGFIPGGMKDASGLNKYKVNSSHSNANKNIFGGDKGSIEQIIHGSMTLKGAGSAISETDKAVTSDEFSFLSPSTWGLFDKGGVTPHAPIKPTHKVNDMIMTSDGKMIETHPDDNIIAKKGGITQKSGGGKSRVEELLMQLIAVTKESGDVYMDGAKVSAAVNQSNYNA